jgi:hypothetical protein
MRIVRTVVALSISALFAAPALAQHVDDIIQRNANQQERIEQGLRSGQLTVEEAAYLERRAARIEAYQSRALADGHLSAEEAQRIDRAQDRFGRAIRREATDADVGNPNSRSAQRMADDVARNAQQQQRIADGVRRGDLTNREVARLERGQAHVNRQQAYAGADGHIGRHEQQRIHHAQDHQSHRIWRERHDEQVRGQGWHAPRYSEHRDHPGYNGRHRGWENRTGGGGQGYSVASADTRNARTDRAAGPGRGQQRERQR